MKKIVIAVIAIVTLASCTQAKFGVINTEKLIKEYKGTLVVESEMKVKSEQSQKNLEKEFQSFQAKVTAYQKNAGKMSAKNRTKTEQQLGAEQQMLQQKNQQIQYQTQSEGQEAIKKIAEKVNVFIKDYGKKNNYKIIFGTVDLNGAVMYNEDSVDLTESILTALNSDYDKDNSSDKKEEAPVKTEDVKKEIKTETKKEETKK